MEIETSTGIQTLTLEYNDNDSPYEAAQAFIDKNQVHSPSTIVSCLAPAGLLG